MEGFSDHLFWDVTRTSVNLKENAPWLVRRVLEYGRWSDFQRLIQILGRKRTGQLAAGLRSLEPKAWHFASAYFNIPLDQFRCSTPIASQIPS